MKYNTIETFQERINKKVIQNLMIEKCNTMIKDCNTIIISENKKVLKLLGDILIMDFLPHKVELKIIKKKKKMSNKMYFQEQENIVFKRFISNKLPKNIEYKTSIIYELTRKFGFNLPFWVVRDFCLQKSKQKKIPNKYIHLDKYR